MTSTFPYLLSSSRDFIWTLPDLVLFDYFGFQKASPGALLLIGMHLTDQRPWTCARNPLYFAVEPGMLDLESKRILGKRYKTDSTPSAWRSETIDTIARVNQIMKNLGHTFGPESEIIPNLDKEPGKLLPRKLTAKAEIVFQNKELKLYSRNISEISQCLHAELTLIFGLSQILSELPSPPPILDAFDLDTTLKPCRMCAAFLHILRKKCQNFSVSYQEDDPGPLAANTLLDRFGYQGPIPNSGDDCESGVGRE